MRIATLRKTAWVGSWLAAGAQRATCIYTALRFAFKITSRITRESCPTQNHTARVVARGLHACSPALLLVLVAALPGEQLRRRRSFTTLSTLSALSAIPAGSSLAAFATLAALAVALAYVRSRVAPFRHRAVSRATLGVSSGGLAGGVTCKFVT